MFEKYNKSICVLKGYLCYKPFYASKLTKLILMDSKRIKKTLNKCNIFRLKEKIFDFPFSFLAKTVSFFPLITINY